MEKIQKAMEEISAGVTNFISDLTSGKFSLSSLRGGAGSAKKSKTSLFEINLVPDIKAVALKTQKIRNLFLFAFMVLGGFSVFLFVIFGIFIGSQQITISDQTKNITSLDKKVNSFSSLNEFLTLQGQLSKISELNDQKRNLSRTFYIMSSLLAQGPDAKGNRDKITVSELNVDMDQSIISIEAQADAGKEPYIDYRVLEAFKKAASATNYDYGDYVDESGNKIPARCIYEATSDGNLFMEGGNLYGSWYKKEPGCDPSAAKSGDGTAKKDDSSTTAEEKVKEAEQKASEALDEYLRKTQESQSSDQNSDNKDQKSTVKQGAEKSAKNTRYTSEPVKIWRIPKFEEWSKSGNIDDSGKISGVAHFESKCVKYNKTSLNGQNHWQAENDCMLLSKPVEVSESTNARNANGNLVLRFSAKIHITPDVFMFKNKHVIPLTPAGQNVTDSYLQVENIFEQKAVDCRNNDTACKNSKNEGK